MPYSKEQRAEYQREYRKRQRREQVMDTTMPAQAVRDLIDCQDEVARLKKALAARPIVAQGSLGALAAVQGFERNRAAVDETLHRFGVPRPAPKPGAKKR